MSALSATGLPSGVEGLGFRNTQSLQNPLIKEYTLNHIRDPTMIYIRDSRAA